ncbi:MAG: DUF4097 family beta strand repeat-containing protein [Bryobacteraceae bacterium]|jgi:hypothetical protein
MNRLIVSIFVCAALAAAQDKTSQDKTKADQVTVALSDPAQPATVKVRLVSGRVTVTAGSSPQVLVGAEPSPGPRVSRAGDDAPSGMRRIDTPGRGFKVEEDHNVVLIGAERAGRNVNLLIQVPVDASLDVETTNGSIALTNVSGAVSARTANGSVTVRLDHPPPDKPTSLSSLNGRIDVTIPADTKARLLLKATNGAIYTDFDAKIEPDGTRSINGGGPDYSFQTTSGAILIHSKTK